MIIKQIVLVFLSIVLSGNSAFAFISCQPKYDNNPRALNKNKGNCGVCHINSNGSGPQNDFGKAFLKNGKKITDDLIAQFPELFKKEQVEEDAGEEDSDSSVVEPVAPVIKRVKPKKVFVNLLKTLKIKGKDFQDGITTFIDNQEVDTVFRSSMLLLVDILLDTVGVHEVQVQNPDGQESNVVRVKAKEKKQKKSNK